MHYIRFLKTPKVQIAGPASASLTALVTVTTDLGETFYSGDVLLRTDLLQRKKLPDIAMPTLLYSGKVSWKAGSRTVGINFNFNFGGPGDDEQGDLILRVSSDNPRPANDMTQKWQGSILSVRSAPIQLTSNGEPSGHYCERVLRLGLVTFLSIWEDTGESIARHVWDGGLALTVYLAKHIPLGEGPLVALHEKLRSDKPLKVIELGSGCGIVGLALVALQKDCHVTLTDLPSAREILYRNMEHSEIVARPGKTSFQLCDWDKPIPKNLETEGLDMILVADCTYNPDSAMSLVNTIKSLVNGSMDTIIVLAHKVRHDSETLFFDMMRANHFDVVDHLKFPLSGEELVYMEEPPVDIYTIKLLRR